jgi:signal transduction histidine kinase
VPIVDDDGRLIAVEGIGRDISARIEGEDSFRRLAAALQEAREHERTAVARELHDELGQTLTSLKMDIVRAASDLSAAGGVGIDRLQSMIGAVELATETVRRLATALRPPALDHLGLVAAIELEAAAMARRSRVRCRVVAKKPVAPLRPEQSTALFRIVQEALTNVQRHANASAVTITVTQRSKLLSIVIRDNGRGITAAELDDPASIGLLGMRERAAIAGATVAIGATPRRGTAVSVILPTP